jgi:fructose-1,6-bisphosphatase/inositol monophosphatase family enzyme
LWDVAAGIAVTLAAGGALRLLDTDDATRHVVLCANETLLAAVEHRLFT